MEADCDKLFMPTEVEHTLPVEMWIMVFSYLSHGDLLQVRLTCKHWSEVSQLREFRNKSKLCITEDNACDIEDFLKYYSTDRNCLRYERVTVDRIKKGYFFTMMCILCRLGQSVLHFSFKNEWLLELNLHLMMPNLRTLFGDCTDGKYDNYCSRDIFNLSLFRKLHCLEIEGLAKGQYLFRKDGRYAGMLELVKLHLTVGIDQESVVLSAIDKHANSLQYLELKVLDNVRFDLSRWQKVFLRLTHLHSIVLSATNQPAWMQTIFKTLSSRLPLRQIRIIGNTKEALFIYIIRKWTKTLDYINYDSPYLLSNAGLVNLKNLQNNLKFLRLSNITKSGLLEGIASQLNTRLRELRLKNVGELDESTICLLAQHLPNLESLSLSQCDSALTNTGLAQIFRYQTRLRVLKLERCTCISDAGILGLGDEPYSIRRLRGLKSLHLSWCHGLTNKSLIEGFHFIELKSLHLSVCRSISEDGIKGLVRNCPVIENLNIQVCAKVNSSSIIFVVENLKRVRKIQIKDCPLVTRADLYYFSVIPQMLSLSIQ